ncbi:hypothetical protein TUSST3_40650 [Streptomyces sp. TUS-ST3]|nr:hypothetical protein TUSST3_40650 [Streptomyces sp. TUS-ST3]
MNPYRTTNASPVLVGAGLKKSYALTRALAGVDVSVSVGESLAIMGPSGSGKSTLLHCLAGIERPDEGQVLLAGERVDQLGEPERSELRRTLFGFVFQSGQLLPELPADENVALPLMLGGISGRARSHRQPAQRTFGVGRLGYRRRTGGRSAEPAPAWRRRDSRPADDRSGCGPGGIRHRSPDTLSMSMRWNRRTSVPPTSASKHSTRTPRIPGKNTPSADKQTSPMTRAFPSAQPLDRGFTRSLTEPSDRRPEARTLPGDRRHRTQRFPTSAVPAPRSACLPTGWACTRRGAGQVH